MSKVAVIGCGSWGTALAQHLSRSGYEVALTGNEPDVLAAIAEKQENTKYFPGHVLSAPVAVTTLQKTALNGAELVVLAVPSFAMRGVISEAKASLAAGTIVVSVAKGLEGGTLKTMSGVLSEELGEGWPVAVLSGPSFALEVLRGLPTAVTIASRSEETAKKAAVYFHHQYFRVYTSTDLVGVELGGAVKNIIALAAGVVDGLGMGNNARAALITRGVAEMQRLITALGGKPQTVAGLSGLGDLLLTATSDLSRNRRVGIRLGKGEKLPEIVASLGQVAEAVETASKALDLARQHGISVPIVEQVDAVLAGRVTAGDAVKSLLAREQRAEDRDLR